MTAAKNVREALPESEQSIKADAYDMIAEGLAKNGIVPVSIVDYVLSATAAGDAPTSLPVLRMALEYPDRPVVINDDYVRGWNACIDQINSAREFHSALAAQESP